MNNRSVQRIKGWSLLNGIIRFSLNNKFALWIMTFIVVAAGLYAGLTMKQETIPDINVPVISITTVYPGAAPDEVAEQVTRPLEQRLRNLNGVDTVQSMSMENVSSLFIQYDYEKDMKEALEEAREAVDSVRLPRASEPTLSRITFNALPVLVVSVSSDTQSLEALTALIEEGLRPSLEGLDGVSEVQISGQYVREVVLTWKEDKLAEYGLSKDMVQGIIQGSVLKAPLGLFEMEKTQKNIVVDGGVRSLEELRNLAIPLIPSGGEGTGAGMGGAGGIGDAAGMNPAAGMGGAAGMDTAAGMGGAAGMDSAAGMDAEMGMGAGETGAGDADMLAALMNSGLPTVPLSEIGGDRARRQGGVDLAHERRIDRVQIVKAPEANTVDVVNDVKAEAGDASRSNTGLKHACVLDQGEPIEQSVETMLDKALFGAMFAVIIILLFLRISINVNRGHLDSAVAAHRAALS